MSATGLVAGPDEAPALIEAATGRTVSYAELRRLISDRRAWADEVAGGLLFLGVRPTVDRVVDLLALLGSGVTTALVDPATSSDVLDGWIDAYEPERVVGLGDADRSGSLDPTHRFSATPADAILLPTSGSTGNPKFVRLSAANVVANANQIAAALSIESDHRALAHLPLFYSYGLSILTSHLVVGASVVLTDASAVRPEFWEAMEEHEVTSLPGVPYNYEMYRRMKLLERDLPALRDVTQAGGRLNSERIEEFHTGLSARGVRMWVMYGQTEATARIAVMPHDELSGHVGSVGYALPDGRIDILDPDADGVGEVQYSGPNVMLGYAESRRDLDAGDTMGGTLSTGDLGRLDAAGRLWITGRSKRIAKVFGTRVNLDDVERTLAALGPPLAATSGDDVIKVFVESAVEITGFARQCERALGFSPRSVQVSFVERLPTTPAGKIAYQELLR